MRSLAHRLAAERIDAFRFDYSGTGDSWGDASRSMSLTQWRTDIDDAIDELRGLAGVSKISLIGLRAGAMLALDTACRRPRDIDRLVAWDPLPCAPSGSVVTEQGDAVSTLEPNLQLANELASIPFALPASGKVSVKIMLSDSSWEIPEHVKESIEQLIAIPGSPVCWKEERDFGAGAVPTELIGRIVREWTE